MWAAAKSRERPAESWRREEAETCLSKERGSPKAPEREASPFVGVFSNAAGVAGVELSEFASFFPTLLLLPSPGVQGCARG